MSSRELVNTDGLRQNEVSTVGSTALLPKKRQSEPSYYGRFMQMIRQ